MTDSTVDTPSGKLTVGIPQGLLYLYYKYAPAWRVLFETVGWNVVVSKPTSQGTVRRGTELGENELCLPVKVFFGHLAELDGACDALFVPRIVSVQRREYTCPKFLGLPDMSMVHGFGTPLISPTFDMREGAIRFWHQHYEFARELGANRRTAVRATRAAGHAQRAHDAYMQNGSHLRLARPESDAAAATPTSGTGQRLRIGVAGHPYNIYDPHVSQNLLQRLTDFGFDVTTSDMVSHAQVDTAVADLPKSLFWTYEKEVVGAVAHWVRHGLVDGVVYVLSFACGPDSIVQTLIEDEIRTLQDAHRVPLLCLIIDEHSAEAGFVTRIEAFADMLAMRELERVAPRGAVLA